MGKFIPVEPEKWAEMVKAQAEVASLKAEVERLTSDIQMEKENEDRLVREWQKANNEVYGLQRQVAALIDDQTSLKAEVERLTKAANWVLLQWDANNDGQETSRVGSNSIKELRNAAKKGGQP